MPTCGRPPERLDFFCAALKFPSFAAIQSKSLRGIYSLFSYTLGKEAGKR
jgi:hypothetical protein